MTQNGYYEIGYGRTSSVQDTLRGKDDHSGIAMLLEDKARSRAGDYGGNMQQNSCTLELNGPSAELYADIWLIH